MNKLYAMVFIAMLIVLVPFLFFVAPVNGDAGQTWFNGLKLSHEFFGIGLILSSFLVGSKFIKSALIGLGFAIFIIQKDGWLANDLFNFSFGSFESMLLGIFFGFVTVKAFFSHGRHGVARTSSGPFLLLFALLAVIGVFGLQSLSSLGGMTSSNVYFVIAVFALLALLAFRGRMR